MATVRPFAGLRFSDATGCLADLVAPPYDVLSDSERDAYAAKNPHNIVHLTLPEQRSDDRSKFVKYARSAALLEEWRRSGAVSPEPRPSFYRYSQTFSVPHGTFTRRSLVVLLKVEPYDRGVVLPHEQTFPKHKEDRLRLLEATRSHLECIFGLYEDDDRSVHQLVTHAPGTTVADLTTPEDGIRQTLEVVSDPDAVQSIQDALNDRRLWIADGHHRYETALAFRESLGPRENPIAEDFMMMAVDSMTDPGLVLLPTHRILKTLPCTVPELQARLSAHFEIESAPDAGLMEAIQQKQATGHRAFGVAIPGGQGFVASVKDVDAIAGQIEGSGSQMLKRLDVSILHGFIFEKLLSLTGLDFFSYTRDDREAVGAVGLGAPASFLMNPPTVEDMRLIALGGEKMPQKSTYYYPKLLSGLVMWSLKDF